MNPKGTQLRRDTPATYRIRLQGALRTTWAIYLNNVTVSVDYSADDRPVTVLTGELVDQAELLGILNNAYDLGYPLLSVECLDYE